MVASRPICPVDGSTRSAMRINWPGWRRSTDVCHGAPVIDRTPPEPVTVRLPLNDWAWCCVSHTCPICVADAEVAAVFNGRTCDRVKPCRVTRFPAEESETTTSAGLFCASVYWQMTWL